MAGAPWQTRRPPLSQARATSPGVKVGPPGSLASSRGVGDRFPKRNGRRWTARRGAEATSAGTLGHFPRRTHDEDPVAVGRVDDVCNARYTDAGDGVEPSR